MKHLKRYAAFCMALVVACSALAVPASATDYQSTYNFWNWAYDNSWFLGKAIIGFSAGNVCQVSEDGLHHATTHSGGGGSVDGQRVYKCVCDFCGQEFQAVATDLEQSYDTIINDNNYTGVSSDNGIYVNCDWVVHSTSTDRDNWSPIETDFWYYPDAEFYYYVYRSSYSTTTKPTIHLRYYFTFAYPVYLNLVSKGGYYVGSGQGSAIQTNTTVKLNTATISAGYEYQVESNTEYYIDFAVQPDFGWSSSTSYYGSYVWIVLPEFYFVPYEGYSGPTVVDRPSTFNPSFTYQDGDGWQVHTNGSLIDETNLTYYNPVTNTTTNIQNWSYDYSDRSYTVLTDSNNATTITYGDEYITINEGDNITYNIYYYTAPDSSGDGDSSGSDGSGDDDGGGLLDKIGELIGSVLGGFIDVIGAALGKVIDSLIDLVTLTIDKLVNVINLFGSFGDALGVLWSWLPEEVVTVLVSGVTVIVFASVIKLFMR